MNTLTISSLRKAMRNLEEKGHYTTLLGIGPVSRNVIRASFECAKEYDFPLFFIATRNAVDLYEFGGGYLMGWNQKDFSSNIKRMAQEACFKGFMYLCRDHGGPWTREEEEKEFQFREKEAMDRAKLSFVSDLESGFTLLHIDPTRDPHVGMSPFNVVIDRTLEIMEFIEEKRKKSGLPSVGYETGTEDIRGGTTDPKAFRNFIDKFLNAVKKRNLSYPDFIVGQTGTLVRLCRNMGKFDLERAHELACIARQYGIGFKEHNADYLDPVSLARHPELGITAANVAPEFGAAETRAYLEIAEMEEKVNSNRIHYSKFRSLLTKIILESRWWKKWLPYDMQHITIEKVKQNSQLLDEIIHASGHYVFNNPQIREARNKLFENIRSFGILDDPNGYVLGKIKVHIEKYIKAFNLKGLTSLLLNTNQ